jgi:RimJ/RimL family protein N-acetyltransferase
MIETDRLFITLISGDDAEDVRKLHNEPETLRWLSDMRVVSPEEQSSWLSGLQHSKTSQRYVAREKSINELVGVFRFDRIDYQNLSAEVGLDVATRFRRMGYAKEIYHAMLPYLFSEFSLNRLSLITLATNTPAINLYESLGFEKEGTLRQAIRRDDHFLDAIQYSLLATEIYE